MSEALDRYRELESALRKIRATGENNGEDRILDQMEQVWLKGLTETEKEELLREGSQTFPELVNVISNRCRICAHELREPTDGTHVKETAERVPEVYDALGMTPELVAAMRQSMPGFGNICLGCFVASTQLELFLIRAQMETVNGEDELGHAPMGDWASGWLREILKEPTRYR